MVQHAFESGGTGGGVGLGYWESTIGSRLLLLLLLLLMILELVLVLLRHIYIFFV